MINFPISYELFKEYIFNNKVRHKYIVEIRNDNKYYTLSAIDDGLHYKCYINEIDNTTEISEYESIYKSYSYTKLEPIESLTNWMKVRSRKVAGDLKGLCIYFTTGDYTSFDAGNSTEYTMTVTSTGTYINFSPTYDYEIAGGYVTVHSTESEMSGKEMKLSFIMAPNIPEEYGGSWPFISNKKFCQHCLTYEKTVDPKLMKYNAENPYINEIQIKIEYDTNPEIEIELYLDIYIV